jgi:hypothetical protein
MENKIKITSSKTLLDYRFLRQHGNVLIETGSAAGDGIKRALDAKFDSVCSIEAHAGWYEKCLERFGKNTKVKLIYGKSTDKLKTAIEIFNIGNPNFVFYLDAHASGEASASHKELMEFGPDSEYSQDNIIKAELDIILAKKPNSVIVIDDVNGLDDGHAVEYCEKMLAANPNFRFFFFDENLSGKIEYYYYDKLLVALPY